MEKDLELILNLFDDTGEDPEFVQEYLREAGYKPEALLEEAKELVRKKEIELKIKKGEEQQRRFETELSKLNDKEGSEKRCESYAMAARKMENMNGEDEKIINENEEMLKKMSSEGESEKVTE